MFRCQTREERETCCQQTFGIDMFVTSERMIILDTQPLLSSAILDHMIHNDKKYSAEYSSVENCVEIQVSCDRQVCLSGTGENGDRSKMATTKIKFEFLFQIALKILAFYMFRSVRALN